MKSNEQQSYLVSLKCFFKNSPAVLDLKYFAINNISALGLTIPYIFNCVKNCSDL